MAKLGSFGAAIRELEPGGDRDTFEFFDQTFTVVGVIPAIVDLKVAAGFVGELSTSEANAAVFEALRHALTSPSDTLTTETEWDRFYLLATSRKCDMLELMKLCVNLIAAQAARPTGQRSTSEAGSLPTSTSSSSSASATPDSPDGTTASAG